MAPPDSSQTSRGGRPCGGGGPDVLMVQPARHTLPLRHSGDNLLDRFGRLVVSRARPQERYAKVAYFFGFCAPPALWLLEAGAAGVVRVRAKTAEANTLATLTGPRPPTVCSGTWRWPGASARATSPPSWIMPAPVGPGLSGGLLRPPASRPAPARRGRHPHPLEVGAPMRLARGGTEAGATALHAGCVAGDGPPHRARRHLEPSRSARAGGGRGGSGGGDRPLRGSSPPSRPRGGSGGGLGRPVGVVQSDVAGPARLGVARLGPRRRRGPSAQLRSCVIRLVDARRPPGGRCGAGLGGSAGLDHASRARTQSAISSQDRIDEVVATWRLCPLLGVGPGQFILPYDGGDGRGWMTARYAHNEYLQVLAVQGRSARRRCCSASAPPPG
jgi:hypothetical protein